MSHTQTRSATRASQRAYEAEKKLERSQPRITAKFRFRGQNGVVWSDNTVSWGGMTFERHACGSELFEAIYNTKPV